ncbi:MAG: SUMF1/EgtB/PvdO family nonheme iron enzyme [Caldilineaceae bacterium]
MLEPRLHFIVYTLTPLMDYLDFDLEMLDRVADSYPLAVRGDAGDARALLRLPFDPTPDASNLALHNRQLSLRVALLSSGGRQRRALSREEEQVQQFGGELFEALMVGDIRSRYDLIQERANRQGKGVRIRLRIQPPELAMLPWEFLYDRRSGEYVGLSFNTPIVRYLETAQPLQPLNVPAPLRVLGLVCSPKDLEPLDVALEKQRVETALRDLLADGLVELTWLDGQTWRHLQRAMRRGPWHIFHFIGHGDFDLNRQEGLIALEDDTGNSFRLYANELSRLLADHRSLRLTLLNACEGAHGGASDLFSSTAAALVRRGVPAVLAMQYKITDAAAIEFARTFYESIAESMPVDAATSEARKAISIGVANSHEWGVPVLMMRSLDGRLFEVGEGDKKTGRGEEKKTEVPSPKPGTDYDAVIAELRAQLVEQQRRWNTEQKVVESEPKERSSTLVTPAVIVRPKIEFDWVTIPAGEFLMGSDKTKDKDAYDDELPQHKLYLPNFKIARVPVTVVQFAQFVKATHYKTTAEQKGSAWNWAEKDGKWQWLEIKGAYWGAPRGAGSDVRNKQDHPVTCVSWHDAMQFCQWAEVRLPSEAEWEKAARGSNGRIYPWGNEAPDQSRCNFNMNVGDTTSVGSYPKGATPEGLLDMAGNVWEWTISLWGKDGSKPEFGYPYKAGDGRENLSAGNDVYRLLRGGSWSYNPSYVRGACRNRSDPDDRDDDFGFRVVVSVAPGS